MRKYLHIHLNDHHIEEEEFHGEDIVNAGRYFIAKTMVEKEIAKVDPLSPDNLLIFSAGPFAGTNFSNANRTSVGCKSPLTGGIKEANGGGTFSYGLGQLNISGFTLYGAASEWVVIHIQKDGSISFDSADPYLGKGNFEVAELLHEKYGKKVSLGICGPVGEYEGLLAGIAFSDSDRRPSRMAARGGVGAVMGSKKVKAIVVDLHKIPQLHDRKKVMSAVKTYAKKLRANETIVKGYVEMGTMGMADYTNYIGGLPVNNFTSGQQVNPDEGVLKMGGGYIREQTLARGGKQTHACMPGCVIQCSNVYVDADGKEIVSPVEYETLCLLGTNCGITEPDDLARLNAVVNDLGIDTIETGAMLAVLMDAGEGQFGDVDFMYDALNEIRLGTEKGKLYALGTARVGEHFKVKRVPVIKKQAISAYDPRVIEVTAISMMTTAQGADHTTGNLPRIKTKDKAELKEASLNIQTEVAAYDSLGLCVFGRFVTKPSLDFIVESINAAHDTQLDASFFMALGRETLRLEREFSDAVGFTADDNELPQFFYDEPLEPTNKVARIHGHEVHDIYEGLKA